MGKRMIDKTFGDVLPSSPGGVCCCGLFTIINIIGVILLGPLTVRQLDAFYIGLQRNTMTGVVNLDKVFMPGRYFIGFWNDFVMFPSTLNTIEFSEDIPEEGVQHLSVLRSRDKDGKQVYLDISVQYLLQPEKLGQLYRDMTIQYEDVYISELRDAFTKAGNLFAIDEVWADYSRVETLMHEKCKQVLARRYATCWGLQLWGVRLEKRYEEVIIRTQVRKQAQRTETERKVHATIRADTQVELAGYRKNVTVIMSEAEAAKYNIERAAKASAEAKLVALEADVLQKIRDTVVPNATATKMTDEELVEYQKYLMLGNLKESSLVYHPFGGSLEPTNAINAKKLMAGTPRRLQQSGGTGVSASPATQSAQTDL
eukprot:TRINITY_DN27146_c0_g2_i1.p1 TRINITY_DN27146_c0_g2~~TRINITY_DN27146_c0_g2_i1.p1  ORF type:complete len:408 (+),score=81.84 TRINITY_DN27146_c0_g2_i1:112-1224(+)